MPQPPTHRLRHYSAFLLALLLPLAACRAEVEELSADYALREWRVRDGLPHNEVTQVRQTQDGFLWVATEDGLARFDGTHFEPVSSEGCDPRHPPVIRAMAETEGLGLVMAPESGGLLACKAGNVRPLSLAGNKIVNALFTHPDGSLWLGCEDGVVLRHQNSTTISLGAVDGGMRKSLAYFATDARGRLWIANGKFLGSCLEGIIKPVDWATGGSELRIASSRRGAAWLILQEGVCRLGDKGPEAGIPLPLLAGAHYVRTLLEDRNGALWIGTRSQGLFVLEDGVCLQVPTSGEEILSLCEDSEGDIWAATNGGGLNRVRKQAFRLFDKRAGLKDNFSYTLCEDAEGTMWFGNRDGGIARARKGVVEVLSGRPSWPRFNAMSVYPHPDGGIWVTAGSKVYHAETTPSDRLVYVPGIPSLAIMRLSLVTRNGDYWVSMDPDKLGRLSMGHFTLYGANEGLLGGQIRCISQTPEGTVLAGTASGKLYEFKETRFEQVHLGETHPLAALQAVLPDANGRLWIGTAGDGLGVFSTAGFRLIDHASGLVDDHISQIIQDEAGDLWFGSMAGIFRVRHHELDEFLDRKTDRIHPVLLGRDDGVQNLSCLGVFQPAAWKSRDHKLWFATRQGVLCFDPDTILPDAAPPPASIVEVRCDDRPHPLGPTIKIASSTRKLEFRFSVLCLSTPDRVQLKYRMDGFDSEWISSSSGHGATYPSLPAGNYTLHVISSLGNGVWSDADVSLFIISVPPWWQRIWFHLSLSVLTLLLIVLVVRTWSHRRLRMKLERLQRASAVALERSRIARNIHDDLGASLTRISLLTQYAKSGDTSSAPGLLDDIHATASEATRAMDEIVWAINPRHDNLESLAVYLANFAQSFLKVARIRCRLVMPEVLPPLPLGSQVRHNLFLCFKEALNNTVRHAQAGSATITMELDGDTLRLEITDDGLGMGASSSGDRSLGGHGLANMLKRMDEIGGGFVSGPAPERGWRTVFSIFLKSKPATTQPLHTG